MQVLYIFKIWYLSNLKMIYYLHALYTCTYVYLCTHSINTNAHHHILVMVTTSASLQFIMHHAFLYIAIYILVAIIIHCKHFCIILHFATFYQKWKKYSCNDIQWILMYRTFFYQNIRIEIYFQIYNAPIIIILQKLMYAKIHEKFEFYIIQILWI